MLSMSVFCVGDLAGALSAMFEQFPIAAWAGPFEFGWGSYGLTIEALSLMEDAGNGVIKGFGAEFATQIGLVRAIAGGFMGVTDGARCQCCSTEPAWELIQRDGGIRWPDRSTQWFVFGVLASAFE